MIESRYGSYSSIVAAEVEAVQARIVEELALDPPCIVVHLLPFGARIGSDLDVVGVERLGGQSAGGDGSGWRPSRARS